MAESLKARFDNDDQLRRDSLTRARDCAALAKPWILPRESRQPDKSLPENYQSVGSRGATTVEGKMLMALYPPGVPWHQSVLPPKLLHDPLVPDEQKQQMLQVLLLRDLTITATLEQTQLRTSGKQRRRTGFRSAKRMALSQLLITGDVLERIDEHFRMITFRRDQYVTKRDSAKDVLYHITREQIDPLTLTPKQWAASNLAAELREKPVAERMQDLFTLVEWQPIGQNWVIRQEVNENDINESTEQVSPYFTTAYELVAGDNYGKGLIDQNFGDLRSYDEIRLKSLDFAALASKQTPVTDYASQVRPTDLTKPSGEPITARVRDGRVQDVAWLSPERLADFGVVHQTGEVIRKDLGAAMLIESDTTPTGERVTAFQVQRVALELDAASGGVYAAISDEQQLPLLDRVIWQMESQKLLLPLKDENGKELFEVKILTGIEALSREVDAAKLVGMLQVIGSLGPEAVAKINIPSVVDALARYNAFFAPGVIKSNEQLAQEQQAALAAQVQQQAAQKAVDVVGNVAEQQATQPQGEPVNG